MFDVVQEVNDDGLTLTAGGWTMCLCSQAAFIAATLFISTSPSDALASHSSIVRADLGFGVRIFRAGVFERLAAINWLRLLPLAVKRNLILSLLISTPTSTQMTSFSVNDLVSSSGPLVITDQLASPADFLLHQLLSEYVRSSPDARCIIISTAQDLAKWKAIASRSES